MSSRKHSKQCNNFFHKVPTLNVFLFVGIVSKLLKVFSINCTKDYIHSSSQTSFLPVFWLNSEQHTDNFHFDWSYYFPTELKLLSTHQSTTPNCSNFKFFTISRFKQIVEMTKLWQLPNLQDCFHAENLQVL